MTDLIFISVSNYGAIELTKNHLTSLKQNEIYNYMAYVTDTESYEELTKLGFNATIFNCDDINVGKNKMNYGNNDYNHMTYLRYYVIQKLLKEGKIVWYLDVDTVALTNLNNIYETLDKTIDIHFQSDIVVVCTGCMLIFPNDKNVMLMNTIIQNKTNTLNDQDVMNQLLNNEPNTLNLSISTLSKYNFPNGLLYFNELDYDQTYKENQINFRNSTNPVYFVHANFMVGINIKIEALKQKKLWFI
jgi:lipopolysaccharide biosynthesis glycosyltransferase